MCIVACVSVKWTWSTFLGNKQEILLNLAEWWSAQVCHLLTSYLRPSLPCWCLSFIIKDFSEFPLLIFDADLHCAPGSTVMLTDNHLKLSMVNTERASDTELKPPVGDYTYTEDTVLSWVAVHLLDNHTLSCNSLPLNFWLCLLKQ